MGHSQPSAISVLIANYKVYKFQLLHYLLFNKNALHLLIIINRWATETQKLQTSQILFVVSLVNVLLEIAMSYLCCLGLLTLPVMVSHTYSVPSDEPAATY